MFIGVVRRSEFTEEFWPLLSIRFSVQVASLGTRNFVRHQRPHRVVIAHEFYLADTWLFESHVKDLEFADGHAVLIDQVSAATSDFGTSLNSENKLYKRSITNEVDRTYVILSIMPYP